MQPTGESGRTGLPPPGAQRLPLSQPSGGTQRGIARRRSTWRRSSARPAKSRPRLVTSRAAARAGAWCCSSPACQSQANVMKREASKAAASMRKPQGPRLGRGSRGVGVPVHGNRPTVQASMVSESPLAWSTHAAGAWSTSRHGRELARSTSTCTSRKFLECTTRNS